MTTTTMSANYLNNNKNREVKVSPGGSHLAPAHSQLAPNGQRTVKYVLGSPPPLGGKGLGGELGVSWSETNVILGFRLPTTIIGKTLIITYSAYVSPPPGSKVPTQCPLT